MSYDAEKTQGNPKTEYFEVIEKLLGSEPSDSVVVAGSMARYAVIKVMEWMHENSESRKVAADAYSAGNKAVRKIMLGDQPVFLIPGVEAVEQRQKILIGGDKPVTGTSSDIPNAIDVLSEGDIIKLTTVDNEVSLELVASPNID